MAQEIEAQLSVGADALQAGVGCSLGFADVFWAQVGQFHALHVTPDQFHGVEVVSVAGELLDPTLGHGAYLEYAIVPCA